MSFRIQGATARAYAPLVASAPSAFRDVHAYDYTYREAAYAPAVAAEDRPAWIERLRERMTRPLAIAGLALIQANHGHMGNLDTTNGKRAEDLLADLAKHIIETESADLLALLEEQLEDMYSLGQCAQGRTTRLWQLLMTTF